MVNSLKKYFGSGFVIGYPEGFTLNANSNGVVMGGDFTINVKAQSSGNKKKGAFPKDFFETDKIGITQNQFASNWVGSSRSYIYKSDILAVQLVPLSGVTVSVMCSAGKETIDFPAKASQILASFIITDEKKLIESINLQLPEDLQTSEKPVQTPQPQKINIDKKGLKTEDFFENDDLFVRLPQKYFAKSIGLEVIIFGITKNEKIPQSITIRQLEKTGLPLDKAASMITGGQKSTPVQIGNQKYLRYDQVGSGSQVMLIGQSHRFEIRITIKGSMGLSGTNMELLKSIVYK
ncbi:MAG: hypothetical protein HGA95_04240 [Caldiserica bacterium]|nr:hypothetical protein [Caldisericota bacterium]